MQELAYNLRQPIEEVSGVTYIASVGRSTSSMLRVLIACISLVFPFTMDETASAAMSSKAIEKCEFSREGRKAKLTRRRVPESNDFDGKPDRGGGGEDVMV